MSHKEEFFSDEEDSTYYYLDFEVHSLTDIENMIEYIKSIKDDDEAAHSCEDKLREEFIVAIAKGRLEEQLNTAANLVLSTNDIKFARWCA